MFAKSTRFEQVCQLLLSLIVAKRIHVENLCSICILVYGYLKLTEFCVILLCFNRLFTLDPQNEKQLLSTDSFVIHSWLVYWVAPLDKK